MERGYYWCKFNGHRQIMLWNGDTWLLCRTPVPFLGSIDPSLEVIGKVVELKGEI